MKGLAYASASYVLWGMFPIYWKLLGDASSLEITAHRMLWSFVFLFVAVVLIRRVSIKSLLKSKRALLILGGSAVLIAVNWFLYTYAVNSGHVIAASLAYFINPIFSICLGMLVFKERLSVVQKIATGLTVCGVVYFAVNNSEPMFLLIALALAALFAVYGALKKKGAYPAVEALTVESLLLVPVALGLVVFTFFMPDRSFLTNIGSVDNLLLSGGLILGGGLSVIPFIFFALGTNVIPLSWMGFVQYISPSISLLLGVFVYGEAFTPAHAVCFILIWAGLLLISGEILVQWWRASHKIQKPARFRSFRLSIRRS